MSRILMVVTAADTLVLADGTTHRTGFWAEELIVARRLLAAAGHDIVLATPGGRRPPVDPASLDPSVIGGDERAEEFRASLDASDAWLGVPVALDAIAHEEFDAIVLPGGHGPMNDLASDPTLGRILVDANDREALIAPFCHGPAGLLSAVDDDGHFTFAGRRMTAFTREEELTGGLGTNTPWFVTDRLSDLGAIIEDAAPWTSHVVRDRNLITGQNPQSSAAVAEAINAALSSR
ncbi:type 1 glutamine amidotransferase domain-containing protein [Microbacterium sp. ZW T5_56]|uniref:type 1 glutamine amidotransferase domain-containing protein n=1 Tax=Microbacterium sp. ZW T5_56 TaxID=3378081 RepID=UPI0038520435